MNWDNIFEIKYIKQEGVTNEELQEFLSSWNKELSDEEVVDINSRKKNPFLKGTKSYELYKHFDPSLWNFPDKKLPSSYIDFLKYSNGGEFQHGNRYLQFLSTTDFREMNLAYELPEYMVGAVSFAMDGCGNDLLFDMRNEPINDEYPIISSHSGSLSYEDSKFVASSFEELCMEMEAIDNL